MRLCVVKLYVVRTGTKHNLDGIRSRGWGLLVSAQGVLRTEGFEDFMLDNGAWTTRTTDFDNRKFAVALDLFGRSAARVVVPDIVWGGKRSLEFSLLWLRHVQNATERVLIPVQDGMEPSDVADLLGPTVGLFIGGGDAFKENTAGTWTALAHSKGAWCHMGRVNAKRRIAIAMAAGCDSIDGSSASRFSKMHPRINRAMSQLSLRVEVPR